MPELRHYVKSTRCKPEDPCYCGSTQLFKQCCGSTDTNRSVPSGVTVINNFFSADECKKFVRFCEKQKRVPLKIGKTDESGKRKELVDKNVRVTETVEIRKRQTAINATINNAVINHIETRIHQKIEWFEQPHVLRYLPGGFYKPHVDSEHFDRDRKSWFRTQDRDISLLLYLNDNFDGGELHFTSLNYRYQPREGDLVYFPSGHLYRHESVPVTKGKKYAIVSWASIVGSPKVRKSYTVTRIKPERKI